MKEPEDNLIRCPHCGNAVANAAFDQHHCPGLDRIRAFLRETKEKIHACRTNGTP